MIVGSKTLEYLRFQKVIDALRDRTMTSMGRSQVDGVGFDFSLERLQLELARVDEVKLLIEAGHEPRLGGISDVTVLLDRASRDGTLAGDELLTLGDSIRGLTRLHAYVSTHSDLLEQCRGVTGALHDYRFLSQRIESTIDKEGAVRDDASHALAMLKERAQVIHKTLRDRLEQFLKTATADEALQEKYYTLREDRYVVPVKSERRSLVEGIVHAVSQTGATVFIEPRFVVSHNNQFKLLQEEISREEYLILQQLSGEIAEEADHLRGSLESAGEFDLVSARARLSVALNGSRPTLNSGCEVTLYGARSPILSLQERPVVPNDILLGQPARLLVLSGPNAGGKSVALGTLGLCVLMVHAGLHIPASPDSTLPYLEGLHAVPGDLEDVEEDLSTFTGHLRELNHVLSVVDEGHLVLVDEIAAGTDPKQGAALGSGYLLRLAQTGCLGIVATHYERLKALAMVKDQFENASMELDWETLSPTYRLLHGAPGASRTFEIARRCSVPDDILDQAREIFEGEGERFLEDAIRQLKEREAQVARQIEENEALQAEALQLKRRQGLALEQLERQASRIVADKVTAGMGDVDDALNQVSALVAQLQKGKPDHRQLERVRTQLRGVKANLRDKLTEMDGEEAGTKVGAQASGTLEVGAEVFVKKFKKKAVVLSLGDDVDTVRLKMGPMTTVLKRSEVMPIAGRPPAPAYQRGWQPPVTAVQTERRLDMRGMNSDEGLSLLEKALDEALLGAHSSLVVVHGHGTGRLKAAVRSYLRETNYSISFRPGKRGEGGDGVTMVEMV